MFFRHAPIHSDTAHAAAGRGEVTVIKGFIAKCQSDRSDINIGDHDGRVVILLFL